MFHCVAHAATSISLIGSSCCCLLVHVQLCPSAGNLCSKLVHCFLHKRDTHTSNGWLPEQSRAVLQSPEGLKGRPMTRLVWQAWCLGFDNLQCRMSRAVQSSTCRDWAAPVHCTHQNLTCCGHGGCIRRPLPGCCHGTAAWAGLSGLQCSICALPDLIFKLSVTAHQHMRAAHGLIWDCLSSPEVLPPLSIGLTDSAQCFSQSCSQPVIQGLCMAECVAFIC